MPAPTDFTGQRFGQFTVIRRLNKRDKWGNVFWHCRCDCGKEFPRQARLIRKTKSCGCLSAIAPVVALGREPHGMTGTPEHNIWSRMIERCTLPSLRSYAGYGGRGIRVCERWRRSFTSFYEDMGPRPSLEHSLDRIDNDGDYEPQNCRWATRKQQQNNRRVTIMCTLNGVERPLAEWCSILGLDRNHVWRRMKKRGWSFEEAIKPIQAPTTVTVDGVTKTVIEWARTLGCNRSSIYASIRRGTAEARIRDRLAYARRHSARPHSSPDSQPRVGRAAP